MAKANYLTQSLVLAVIFSAGMSVLADSEQVSGAAGVADGGLDSAESNSRAPTAPALDMVPALDPGLAVSSTPGAILSNHGPSFDGHAHWYGGHVHGRKTASGQVFDKHKLTAAHPSLPFGTWVRVKSLHTGKDVVVVVTDRCPPMKQRCIDLSEGAAQQLGIWPGAPNAVHCELVSGKEKSAVTQENVRTADKHVADKQVAAVSEPE